MLRIRTLMLIGLLVLAPQSSFLSAQSLEDELSVLDDLPEADLSELSGVESAQVDESNITENNVEPVVVEEPQNLQQEVSQLSNIDTPAPPAALTGVDSEPAANLTAMDFQQLPDRVRLRLKTDRGIDYQIVNRPERRQVMIEIQNANIAAKVLNRALDTGEFDGPVALVKAFDAKVGSLPGVRVLFQLRDFDRAQVTRVGTDLLVDFPIKGNSGKLFEISNDDPVLPETIVSSFDKMTFTGARMNLRVKDAPLEDVLALISRAAGQDFVLAQATDQKVTIQMSDAPWDQVLAMILLNSNMGYQKIGKTYRIATADALRRELESAVLSAAKKKELAGTETRIYPINYAKAEDLDKIIKGFLTPTRVTSGVEDRTNSIVVTDSRDVLDRVGTYIKAIDLQTPQILIEARIVQVREQARKNLDLRWRAGGTESFINIGEGGPSAIPPNAGLRLNASLPGIDAVTAWLNMYETQEQSKIIASPKVMALNNEVAKVYDGTEIAILVPSTEPGGANTYEFRQALLELDVTPSVTADGFVMMKVKLSKDDVINSTNGAIGRKGSDTTLMVESGKTAVIGGIFIDTEVDEERRLSYLGSLPILGRLFTPFKSKLREQQELLMFISPRIINADKATLMSSGSGSQASF